MRLRWFLLLFVGLAICTYAFEAPVWHATLSEDVKDQEPIANDPLFKHVLRALNPGEMFSKMDLLEDHVPQFKRAPNPTSLFEHMHAQNPQAVPNAEKLKVLSYNEVPDNKRIKLVGAVGT